MFEDLKVELEKIVGKDFLITKKEQMESYLMDETADSAKPAPAANVILVKPANASEISRILELANKTKTPVFPRGGGTGLVGGAVPTKDGIVLSMERMDKIEIDKSNLMAVVQAGATLGSLLEAANKADLAFPPHPGDEGAQIGGLVVCNAGGARAIKQGVMRNYVTGMEVVTPPGEILNLGGKLLKNNTGYNLMHLIIGSEGTLGIITKVVLRLSPKFSATATLVIPYENRHDAMETVPKLLRSGVLPLAIEYVEKDLIKESAQHLGKKWPAEMGRAFLIAILDGADMDEVYSKSERILAVAQENHCLEPLMAESEEEQANILSIRSNIYTSLKRDTADILDVTVPPANMGRLMDAIDAIAKRFNTHIPLYGHAGDGNLHPHVMKAGDASKYHQINEEIYKAAVSLGGVITGEHGIGKVRVGEIGLNLDGVTVKLMRGIKKIFDPNNILNPGAVLPIED